MASATARAEPATGPASADAFEERLVFGVFGAGVGERHEGAMFTRSFRLRTAAAFASGWWRRSARYGRRR